MITFLTAIASLLSFRIRSRASLELEVIALRHQANNPQQSWGFEGEPPEAVTKDFGTRDGTS